MVGFESQVGNDYIFSRRKNRLDMFIHDDGDPRIEKWIQEAIERGGTIYRVARRLVLPHHKIVCGSPWVWAEAFNYYRPGHRAGISKECAA